MAPLAITCGDPAGIGPEIIQAWLTEHPEQAGDVVVLGPPRWLATLPTKAGRVAIGLEEFEAVAGRPSAEGAWIAWAALQRAADGCRTGEFSAVVSAPVSKFELAAIGYPHPGQTEFFAAAWGGEPTMAFCGGRLRVVLATWHLPLKHVPAALTPSALARAVRAADELARADGVKCPRIAVCGLNPHAGEAGLLGEEEQQVIDPALDTLRPHHAGLSRTLPGDTVFGRALRGDYDVVVALYHDQGLAPLKTIDFDEAVNVTLGLPFVRTSPDHGTAFGIAGRGVASPRSFTNAVAVARRLLAARSGETRP